MKEISVEELLQKNPDVKKIFEENAKKLEDNRITSRKGTGYGLALPYAGRQLLVQEDKTDKNPPAAASYQRY